MDVFLSHSSTDAKLAERLSSGLEGRGLSVWLDRKDLKPGSDWQREIEDAVRSAGNIVLLIGRHSEPDEVQEVAWRTVLEAVWEDPRKRLIPVLRHGVELPKFVLSGASGSKIRVIRLEDARDLRGVVETIVELTNGRTRTRGARTKCILDDFPSAGGGYPIDSTDDIDSTADSSKSDRLAELEYSLRTSG